MFGFRKLAPVVLSLCLFLIFNGNVHASEKGPEFSRVAVTEGSDAILPCSLSTKENIESKLFDWKKDGQKEVFFYDAGIHYNNGRFGQDDQFKGRVSHFSDQLKNGNASVKIQNTKVADSGNYTCVFPRLQPHREMYLIELVVVGAAPKPHVMILDATENGVLLQCDVQGASPKPKVEWKDRAGNILPAEEPQVSYRGERYYITLLTNVTKRDNYRCVVRQEEIFHQTEANIFVPFCGAAPKPNIETLDATGDGVRLQCEVRGAFPKPKVEWQDRAGNILPAEEPQVSPRGECYYITLRTNVTKTDHYHCVVTQEEFGHQIEAKTFVFIYGPPTGWMAPTGWIVAVVLGILLLLVLVVEGVLFSKGIIKVDRIKCCWGHENGYEMSPVSDHKQGNSLRTEPLLPGSDVSTQTSPYINPDVEKNTNSFFSDLRLF